jgi:hypothetical protein
MLSAGRRHHGVQYHSDTPSGNKGISSIECNEEDPLMIAEVKVHTDESSLVQAKV